MIIVLTYDFPHRKTFDVLNNLLAKGEKDLLVIATPWVERNNFKPLMAHRPPNNCPVPPEEYCRNLNIPFQRMDYDTFAEELPILKPESIVIAGAGIIPEHLITSFPFINAHPGWLPLVKGLDALKWAIYNNEIVGVTLHLISPQVDEGDLIDQKIVPIYFEDTFHSFAFRQYEIEIDLLSSGPALLRAAKELPSLHNPDTHANRRMPHHLERIMLERFEELRKKAPSFFI